jgi:hypothetical protein
MTIGCGWWTDGQGIPASLGFLQNGEAVVTDMHRRSLVRCAGGQAIDRGTETGPKSQSYVDATVVEVPGAGYP